MGIRSRTSLDGTNLSQRQALSLMSLQVICGNILFIQEIALVSSLAYSRDFSQ